MGLLSFLVILSQDLFHGRYNIAIKIIFIKYQYNVCVYGITLLNNFSHVSAKLWIILSCLVYISNFLTISVH